MKSLSYILFGLWVIAGIGLKIAGVVGWLVALSWLWLPLGVLLTAFLALSLTVQLGKKLSKNPDRTCDNCIFGLAVKGKGEKCLGEVLHDGHIKGETCSEHRFVK